ncbi:MAG: hypothetical protein H6744_07050 [Deltaproteobacteria bacterium]|nr:hypothetical protein [Deltaproteobacteria bacterium]MCB9786436.1 hypothetical protein [Deltaproteobacteria bacterium]
MIQVLTIYAGVFFLVLSPLAPFLADILGETSFTTVNALGTVGLGFLALGGLAELLLGGGARIRPAGRLLLGLLLAYVAAESLRGIADGFEVVSGVLFDAASFMGFLGVVALVQREPNRRALERALTVTLLIGMAASVAGLVGVELLDRREVLDSRGYAASSLLSCWPVVFFLGSPSRQRRLIGWAGFFVLMAIIVLAQKRGPFARNGLMLVVPLLVLAGLQSWPRRLLLIFVLALSVVPFYQEAGDNDGLGRFTEGLEQRLTGQEFEAMLITENPRLMETRLMFQAMDGTDLLVGRGMGGYVDSPEPIPWMLNDEIHHPHIGWSVYALKGGAVLIVLILGLVCVAVWRLRDPHPPELRVAAFFVAATAAFQLQETLWGVPSALHVVTMATMVGFLVRLPAPPRHLLPARAGVPRAVALVEAA